MVHVQRSSGSHELRAATSSCPDENWRLFFLPNAHDFGKEQFTNRRHSGFSEVLEPFAESKSDVFDQFDRGSILPVFKRATIASGTPTLAANCKRVRFVQDRMLRIASEQIVRKQGSLGLLS